MSQNNGWTDNDDLDFSGDKAPPPPPDPGLYRFEVVAAEGAKVGKDSKPGIKLQLMLKEPFSGGESVERKVYATHSFKKEYLYVIKQLGEACEVALPKSNNGEEVTGFCARLLDSRGGICRMKHGKAQDGTSRPEIAFGSSYFTQAEAAAIESGEDPAAAASDNASESPAAGAGGRRRRAS